MERHSPGDSHDDQDEEEQGHPWQRSIHDVQVGSHGVGILAAGKEQEQPEGVEETAGTESQAATVVDVVEQTEVYKCAPIPVVDLEVGFQSDAKQKRRKGS